MENEIKNKNKKNDIEFASNNNILVKHKNAEFRSQKNAIKSINNPIKSNKKHKNAEFENQENIEYLNRKTSEESIKKVTNFKMLFATILLFVFYSCICLMLINYPLELGKFLLPAIYVSTAFWIICFGILFLLSFVSFSIVEKQGANIKVSWYFLFFGIVLALEIFFGTVLELMWVSLFLSAISLFLGFVIVHELKKTNKKAYAFFIPCLFVCAYACLNYYVISMIN